MIKDLWVNANEMIKTSLQNNPQKTDLFLFNMAVKFKDVEKYIQSLIISSKVTKYAIYGIMSEQRNLTTC